MENKLTKQQRHEVYKKALETYPTHKFSSGLCFILLETLDECSLLLSHEAEKLFPEFNLFNPQTEDSYWFGNADKGRGTELRKTVLEFCIEMTK